MSLIQKSTIGVLVSLLAGVLLFNGLIFSPGIGEFIKGNPLIIVGIAIALVFFARKISPNVPLMDELTARSAIYTLAGILLFNGIVHIDSVMPLLKENPLWVIGAAFGLLIFRHKIEDFGG